MSYSQAQSLDNSPAGVIKAIFTFEDFTNEIQLPNLSLQVTLGDSTRTIPLPFKDALLLESSDLNLKSKVQFQLEETDGDIVGYTELKIPGGAFIMNETEVNQKIQFQVVKGPKSSFATNVRVIFLNKRGAKANGDESNREASKMTPSSSKKTLLAETLNKNVTTSKQNRSQDNSPLPKKDSPKLKKELSDQYSISQLINLNKSERNIPNESFLDDQSIGQLHLDLESPTKGRDLDLSVDMSSPTKNPKKLSRKGTAEVKEIKPTKKTLKSSLTQVFSPKSSSKGQPTLYDAVKKVTGEMKSPKKLDKRATITFGEHIELNDETQVPEVLSYLEQALGDHDYLRACIEFVKNSMLTTEFKLNEVDSIKSDNEKMKQQVRNVEESKVRLQEKNAASIDTLKQENDQLREKIASLNREAEALNNKYHGSQNEIIKLQENIARHAVTITQKDNDLMSAELKNAELIDTRNKLKRAEETLTRVEGQRINDQKSFTDSLERAKKAFEDAKVLYDKTAQEKREVSMQLNEERLAHSETRNKLVLMERQLENAEAYKEVIKSLEVQRDELLRQLAELRADRDGVYKLVEKTQADMGLKFREYEKRENEHIEKAKIAEEYMKAFEFKYSNLEQELDKSQLNVAQLNTKLVEMEELQTSHDKIAEEVERLKEKLTQAVQHSVNLNSGIDNITENHDAMAQRTMELERANNDLIEVISEKQNEIVYLKQSLAAAINEIPRYVPIKDDPVDAALANILNTNKDAEKYRLLFIRETEGVYQFGTKKIYIKIEGERVLIRVGGGYMTLEELLETIAPNEYDKLQKYSKNSQDQASNLVAKNIVLNQVISGKCVNSLERAKTQAYKYTPKSGVTPKADPAMKNSFSSKVSKPF